MSIPQIEEIKRNLADLFSREGTKIQAIKYIREITGTGLAQAKGIVDAIYIYGGANTQVRLLEIALSAHENTIEALKREVQYLQTIAALRDQVSHLRENR